MSENIRSFRGADAKAAFAAVKAAMGSDAVILSAREVPGGLLRKSEVEVLAMVGTAATLSAARPAPSRQLPAASATRPRTAEAARQLSPGGSNVSRLHERYRSTGR